jgi:hypothetical protein
MKLPSFRWKVREIGVLKKGRNKEKQEALRGLGRGSSLTPREPANRPHHEP